MMDLCDRAGERGRDERCEGEGGLPLAWGVGEGGGGGL